MLNDRRGRRRRHHQITVLTVRLLCGRNPGWAENIAIQCCAAVAEAERTAYPLVQGWLACYKVANGEIENSIASLESFALRLSHSTFDD